VRLYFYVSPNHPNRILVDHLKESGHLEDLSVDGRIILTALWWEDVDWINLAQNRVQWRDDMNVTMNFRFYNRLSALQEGRCFMESVSVSWFRLDIPEKCWTA
jgi:hypothetical protein